MVIFRVKVIFRKIADTWQGEIEFVGENGLLVSQPFNSMNGKLRLKDRGIVLVDEVSLIQYGGDSVSLDG